MIDAQMDARIVKICSMGLKEHHLGKSISTLQAHFMTLQKQCGFNICGEGGEFESIVLDCPLFKTHKIDLEEVEVVPIDKNDLAPVIFLRLKKLRLVEKDQGLIDEHNSILMSLKQDLLIKKDYDVK